MNNDLESFATLKTWKRIKLTSFGLCRDLFKPVKDKQNHFIYKYYLDMYISMKLNIMCIIKRMNQT